MKKFKKGDRVLVRATVYTKERMGRQWNGTPEVAYQPVRFFSKAQGHARPLMRVPCPEPWEGIVAGYSWRLTGFYARGYGWDDPGDLWDQKAHQVVMVIPTDTIKWVQPLPCLEVDLELHDGD